MFDFNEMKEKWKEIKGNREIEQAVNLSRIKE